MVTGRVRGRVRIAVVAGGATGLLLSGCGGGSSEGEGGGASAVSDDTTSQQASGEAKASGPLSVAASFYPLQWVSEQIGGERAAVSSLTAPGVEPHDLELTPREVVAAQEVGLLVTLEGFQRAVDEAAQLREGPVVDVSTAAGVDVEDEDHGDEGDAHETAGDGDGEGPDEHDEHPGEVAGEGESASEAAGDLAADPHFWLDPMRMASVAEVVAEAMTTADPESGQYYADRLAVVQQELVDLDTEYQQGLADCRSRDLVTAHEAFGHLAARYDLRQRGVAGIGGEVEPTAGRLAEINDFVRDNDVRTVYAETLLSPAVAEAVAAETGAATAVLDTLEGLSEASPGEDYPAVMRANLQTLQQGQGCS